MIIRMRFTACASLLLWPDLVARAQAQTACNIAGLFTHLQAITSDADCRSGCQQGGGEASCGAGWYPSAADGCILLN